MLAGSIMLCEFFHALCESGFYFRVAGLVLRLKACWNLAKTNQIHRGSIRVPSFDCSGCCDAVLPSAAVFCHVYCFGWWALVFVKGMASVQFVAVVVSVSIERQAVVAALAVATAARRTSGRS